MDDDAPLLNLTKAPKFDDNTPLALLANPALKTKSGAGRPAAPKAAPKAGAGPATAKGKGRGKPAGPAKRKAAESSSSSSSSDSSSSSSDSERPLKRGKPTKGQKLKLLKKKGTVEDGLGGDGGGPVKNRERSTKEVVVAQLLCRWWYALPDWPPTDEKYYEAELRKRSFRKVSIEEWEWLPDEDEKGRKKVYELSQFKGVFRCSRGDLIDCRPQETCPCYSNFMKKDIVDLWGLLVKAYEGQLVALKTSKYNETKTAQDIKVALTSARDNLQKAMAVSGATKKPR